MAATIARLVAEGKLKSEVREEGRRLKRRVLALELQAKRKEFKRYERRLIDKLFFGKRTETDTDAVRKHYSGKGFDPTRVIRDRLERYLDKAFGRQPPRPSSKPVWLLFAAAVVCLALEAVTRVESARVLVAYLFLTATPVLVFGTVLARRYRKRNLYLKRASLGFLAPTGLLAMASILGVFGTDFLGISIPGLFPGIFGVLALAIMPLAPSRRCGRLSGRASRPRRRRASRRPP